jgi:RHS repeat-associated protein
VLDREWYSPYGSLLTGSGTTAPFGYTGEPYVAGHTLVDLRARYYNPALYRLLTIDPRAPTWADPATVNPYAYVGDNPANRTDPSGQCWGVFDPSCYGWGDLYTVGDYGGLAGTLDWVLAQNGLPYGAGSSLVDSLYSTDTASLWAYSGLVSSGALSAYPFGTNDWLDWNYQYQLDNLGIGAAL